MIPTTLINVKVNDPDDAVEQRVKGETTQPFVHGTLGNQGDKSTDYHGGDSITAIIAINSSFMLVIIILSLIFDKFQIQMNQRIDEADITANHFTVMLQNLPYDTTEEEIREWLTDVHKCEGILHVTLWYKIRKILKKYKEYIKAKEIRSYIISKEANPRSQVVNLIPVTIEDIESLFPKRWFWWRRKMPSVEEIEEKILSLEEEIEAMKKKYNSDDPKINQFWWKAFVTLNSQKEVDRLIKHFKFSFWRRALNYVLFKIWYWRKWFISVHRLRDKRVMISRAAEPEELYWKNIPIKTINRVKYTFITYFIMLVCLAISFSISLGLGIARLTFEKSTNTGNNSLSIFIYILQVWISVLSGIVVSIINIILERIIKLLSAREMYATYTGYNLTVSMKLMFAMFANTALIPLFVNFNTDDWFTRSGLVLDVFYNTLSVSFLSPLISFFDFWYWK